MLQNFRKEDLRILYVASKCIFFIMTFHTESYETLVGINRKYKDKEELLEYFYHILKDKGEDYYKLIAYLDEYVDNAQDDLLCGVFSISSVTKGQFASDILMSIELLDRPVVSIPPTNMSVDF